MHRSFYFYVSIFVYLCVTHVFAAPVSHQSSAQGDFASSEKDEEVKSTTRRKGRQTVEYVQSNTERVRLARANNPTHFKYLDRKNYEKRKSDPATLEHDKKMRKKYYDEHREKIAATKLAYARRKAQEKREKRLLEGKPTRKQTKRVRSSSTMRVGDVDQNQVTPQKKQRISPAKEGASTASQSTERRHIARLKLSSKTIKKFYGSDKPASN